MDICQRCGQEFERLHELQAWDEQEEDRYRFSQALDEEALLINFPGRWVNLLLCADCFETAGGVSPAEQVIEKHTPGGSVMRPRHSFEIRSLQSGLATALARALFEKCGYEVRFSGYEFSVPEWVGRMKQGDPNPAVARLRATPDLQVYDRKLNTLYEVELKATNQQPPIWRYRKDVLDVTRHHHPETLLMVYVQRRQRFVVQRMDAIRWHEVPVEDHGTHQFYRMNLDSDLLAPPSMFKLITEAAYLEFTNEAVSLLRHFVGLDVTN